jgi:hypothetical protein
VEPVMNRLFWGTRLRVLGGIERLSRRIWQIPFSGVFKTLFINLHEVEVKSCPNSSILMKTIISS